MAGEDAPAEESSPAIEPGAAASWGRLLARPPGAQVMRISLT